MEFSHDLHELFASSPHVASIIAAIDKSGWVFDAKILDNEDIARLMFGLSQTFPLVFLRIGSGDDVEFPENCQVFSTMPFANKNQLVAYAVKAACGKFIGCSDGLVEAFKEIGCEDGIFLEPNCTLIQFIRATSGLMTDSYNQLFGVDDIEGICNAQWVAISCDGTSGPVPNNHPHCFTAFGTENISMLLLNILTHGPIKTWQIVGTSTYRKECENGDANIYVCDDVVIVFADGTETMAHQTLKEYDGFVANMPAKTGHDKEWLQSASHWTHTWRSEAFPAKICWVPKRTKKSGKAGKDKKGGKKGDKSATTHQVQISQPHEETGPIDPQVFYITDDEGTPVDLTNLPTGPAAVLLCGPQAVGKSTLIKYLRELHGDAFVVVSADYYFVDKPFDFKLLGVAHRTAAQQLKEGIAAGKVVFVDNTNMNGRDRKAYMVNGVETHLWVVDNTQVGWTSVSSKDAFTTAANTLYQRTVERGREIPLDAIRSTMRKWPAISKFA